MKIQSVTIRGFRCFDDSGEKVDLDDLTCFIGPNASGKTAAMMALTRIFGETKLQRQIVPTDFHLPAGETLKAKSPRKLLIECRVIFPELENLSADDSAIPEVFNQMIVAGPGETPYCRIRLDATWEDDGTPQGDVEQSLSWILTTSDVNEQIDENCRLKVAPGDRARIRVVYVPATRDPEQQIRGTSTTSFGRLLNALDWGETNETLKEKLSELKDQLAVLPGIQTLNTQVQEAWQGLYQGRVAREMAFQALEEDPAGLVKLLAPTFRPGEDGRSLVASDLSDGLRSLFSFSLTLGFFQVEEVLRKSELPSGFNSKLANELPLLTIFAIEEPENHLSPHYLGSIISRLSQISTTERAQVVISSHSPSVPGRVEPENVRYFLGHEHSSSTCVKCIPLPNEPNDEAYKYVREAVRSYPEIYFSRLVILGEGASEQIVLRRLFEASGTPLDSNFISIVPLGGRHVNHFWRLLHGLEIPFITLLDLDREKEGAGWGRIQYVRDQLIERYGAGSEKLQYLDSHYNVRKLDEPEFNSIRLCPSLDKVGMKPWIDFFENRFGVFFSEPLDLDLSMLESFPEEYKGLAPASGGPRLGIPGTPEYEVSIKQRMAQVLASDPSNPSVDIGSSYTTHQQELFPWYKYLFLDGSKPVAHLRALLAIGNKALLERAPSTLARLLLLAQTRLLKQTIGT